MRNKALFFLFWVGSVVFTNPFGEIMSDATLASTVSLVDRGTLEVAPNQALHLSLVDGKYYSGLAPGSSAIAVPVYFLARPLIALLPEGLQKRWETGYAMQPPLIRSKEVYFLQILMVWCLLAPLHALFLFQVRNLSLGLGHSERSALWIVLAVGVGSLSFVYSCVYSRQFLAGVLIWNVLLWLVPPKESSREARSEVHLFAAGLILGLALTIDYTCGVLVLCSLPLLGRAAIRQPRKLWGLAGFAAPVLALAVFHMAWFGNPFATPYHFRAWNTQVIHAMYKGREIASNEFQTGPFLGLSHPTLESLFGLSISSFKGIFFFSPVAALGLAVWARRKSRGAARSLKLVALPAFAILFLAVASLKGELYWSGSPLFFGPRYLVSCAPLLGLGIVLLNPRQVERWVLSGVIGVSAAIMVLGAMFHDQMALRGFNDPSLQAPLAHILRDLFGHGPRVPLLDVSGVSGGLQALVILLYLGGWITAFSTARPCSILDGKLPPTEV